jgi:hypothetical protein
MSCKKKPSRRKKKKKKKKTKTKFTKTCDEKESVLGDPQYSDCADNENDRRKRDDRWIDIYERENYNNRDSIERLLQMLRRV